MPISGDGLLEAINMVKSANKVKSRPLHRLVRPIPVETRLHRQIREYVRLQSEIETFLAHSHELREFLEVVERNRGWKTFSRFLR